MPPRCDCYEIELPRTSPSIRKHPDYPTPDTRQRLDTLNRIDDEYARGFSATGTLVKPGLSGPQQLFEWKLTMGDGQLVLQQRAVDNADQVPAPGRYESTLYTGPRFMAMIHQGRIWFDGDSHDSKAAASTFDLGFRVQPPLRLRNLLQAPHSVGNDPRTMSPIVAPMRDSSLIHTSCP